MAGFRLKYFETAAKLVCRFGFEMEANENGACKRLSACNSLPHAFRRSELLVSKLQWHIRSPQFRRPSNCVLKNFLTTEAMLPRVGQREIRSMPIHLTHHRFGSAMRSRF